LCDLLDDNNFLIFDDVNVRISPVSKMPFRKKPRDSMHVRSKSNMIKSLPRTVHNWLPKLKPLAEPVAKWFPRIVQICLWIIDSGCSKHMTGNRALLTNFVESFSERFALAIMILRFMEFKSVDIEFIAYNTLEEMAARVREAKAKQDALGGEVDYGWNNSKGSRFVKDIVTKAVELGLNKILTYVWKKLEDD
nr:ribonuclease H-like domain-containing protein [Tanacetum cinerariifolium]